MVHGRIHDLKLNQSIPLESVFLKMSKKTSAEGLNGKLNGLKVNESAPPKREDKGCDSAKISNSFPLEFFIYFSLHILFLHFCFEGHARYLLVTSDLDVNFLFCSFLELEINLKFAIVMERRNLFTNSPKENCG